MCEIFKQVLYIFMSSDLMKNLKCCYTYYHSNEVSKRATVHIVVIKQAVLNNIMYLCSSNISSLHSFVSVTLNLIQINFMSIWL